LHVTVSGHIDIEDNADSTANDFMVMDFGDLKKIVSGAVLNDHDHNDLNKIYAFPTAEVMSVVIFNRIKNALAEKISSVTLESVKLFETQNCLAEYRGEIS
jgi:6-pyruvoyl-tetrahydropterin synthase